MRHAPAWQRNMQWHGRGMTWERGMEAWHEIPESRRANARSGILTPAHCGARPASIRATGAPYSRPDSTAPNDGYLLAIHSK